MSESLTVITANTHMGRLLREPGGLDPVAHADVLLLQEVRQPHEAVDAYLKDRCGLRLAFTPEDFGLAIAVRRDFATLWSGHDILQPESRFQRVVDNLGFAGTTLSFRFRARAVASTMIRTRRGNVVQLSTTHPTVPVKPVARSRQVAAIPKVLGTSDRAVILGGDMNHWPGPRACDRRMYDAAGLTPVNIGDVPTYDPTGKPYGALHRSGLWPAGQMDALLYRGNLEVLAARVLPIASDHHAVEATFTLPK